MLLMSIDDKKYKNIALWRQLSATKLNWRWLFELLHQMAPLALLFVRASTSSAPVDGAASATSFMRAMRAWNVSAQNVGCWLGIKMLVVGVNVRAPHRERETQRERDTDTQSIECGGAKANKSRERKRRRIEGKRREEAAAAAHKFVCQLCCLSAVCVLGSSAFAHHSLCSCWLANNIYFTLVSTCGSIEQRRRSSSSSSSWSDHKRRQIKQLMNGIKQQQELSKSKREENRLI